MDHKSCQVGQSTCNLGEKREVMQGGLRGEEAEGKIWKCGMCTCALHLALRNQLTLCLDTDSSVFHIKMLKPTNLACHFPLCLKAEAILAQDAFPPRERP